MPIVSELYLPSKETPQVKDFCLFSIISSSFSFFFVLLLLFRLMFLLNWLRYKGDNQQEQQTIGICNICFAYAYKNEQQEENIKAASHSPIGDLL